MKLLNNEIWVSRSRASSCNDQEFMAKLDYVLLYLLLKHRQC